MMKSVWIVKAYTGCKTGWQEIKTFSTPGEADTWLCKYIKENGYIPTDFNIINKQGEYHDGN